MAAGGLFIAQHAAIADGTPAIQGRGPGAGRSRRLRRNLVAGESVAVERAAHRAVRLYLIEEMRGPELRRSLAVGDDHDHPGSIASPHSFRSTRLPRGFSVNGSRVVQNADAAGPTAIATRSVPARRRWIPRLSRRQCRSPRRSGPAQQAMPRHIVPPGLDDAMRPLPASGRSRGELKAPTRS